MKKLLYTFLSASLLFATSCGDDYLDTMPEDSGSADVIFETADNAKLAINGLCLMMGKQYLKKQGFNGEGTIKTYYGNYPGNDFQKSNLSGWAPLMNSSYIERSTTIYDYYPWFYYYKLIGNANAVIGNIDEAKGDESVKQEVKAQALTFRAYSYTMLSQLYCRRWVDSNNGATRGLPLRIDQSTGDLAASSLAQVYDQIYKDLDDAIANFQQSGWKRSSDDNYTPDIHVAYATYARAALIRQDWAKAAQYAALARKSFPLMSNEEYVDGGFNRPNSEWIWSVYSAEDQTLYYYSFFAYQSSNSNASQCRKYPCAISKELYDQIPETDVRRSMYLEPQKGDGFSKKNGAADKTMTSRVKKERDAKLDKTSSIFAYMQFKFQNFANPGVGHVNNFRSAEMYLIEAEAKCHLNKDQEVQKLLEELNIERNPEYKCNLTGAQLLKEVKLYRRIELWGEGFDWFDLKRWKEPVNRKTYDEGGSFHAAFAVTIQPEEANNWTWVYPNKEIDYNDALDSAFE